MADDDLGGPGVHGGELRGVEHDDARVSVRPSTVVVTAAIGATSRCGDRRGRRRGRGCAGETIVRSSSTPGTTSRTRSRATRAMAGPSMSGTPPSTVMTRTPGARSTATRPASHSGNGSSLGRCRADRERAVASGVEPELHHGVADGRAGDGGVATGPPRHRDLGRAWSRRRGRAPPRRSGSASPRRRRRARPGVPGVRGERPAPSSRTGRGDEVAARESASAERHGTGRPAARRRRRAPARRRRTSRTATVAARGAARRPARPAALRPPGWAKAGEGQPTRPALLYPPRPVISTLLPGCGAWMTLPLPRYMPLVRHVAVEPPGHPVELSSMAM